MGVISWLIDIFLHLPEHLTTFMNSYGILIYLILFLIIFCETGLVVTPFLPGDSLVFAVGALAAGASLSVVPFFFVLLAAALAGDSTNFLIGRFFRDKVNKRQKIRFVKEEYIERTDAFFQKHGGKTIIIARFIPIIRTFVPFVASACMIPYRRFIKYSVVGGVLWISIALAAGYFFGNIPFVKANFSFVIIGIIAVSLIPVIITFIKNKVTANKKSCAPETEKK
jgi:membrane-associated protein